jgi:peptidoglycan/xylan/chitin deacetylase (PgdA/CDA1 family)
VADFIGQTSVWQEESGETPGPLMDKAEIQAWLAAGHEIGSHTRRHPFLTRVSEAEAREKITASKKKLEDMFGVPIDNFCYPYGDHNPVVRDLVEQSGYKTACTTMFGVNDAASDPFLLKRITARYPSRNWKGLKSWLADKFLSILSAA